MDFAAARAAGSAADRRTGSSAGRPAAAVERASRPAGPWSGPAGRGL